MKIYKVCGNYLKGVQEFEIKKINPDNTFIYEQMFVKALLLIRITKVGVYYFRPNFLKPLLSAAAVVKGLD